MNYYNQYMDVDKCIVNKSYLDSVYICNFITWQGRINYLGSIEEQKA
ncbi:hypothetical protein J2S10_003410 [Neobacillus ginsengisoli]|uniref:Uncharacterized protein n=1 Tax=Neobacillus ginsengisoli TaxID=904295 RepID=A0ABT9XXB7_9BACI|nr:hypothetical protein [Neobacillus ginsengisoli]